MCIWAYRHGGRETHILSHFKKFKIKKIVRSVKIEFLEIMHLPYPVPVRPYTHYYSTQFQVKPNFCSHFHCSGVFEIEETYF